MYRAVAFDLDDTLYDLRRYWTERLERAFAAVIAAYPHLDRSVMLKRALTEKIYMNQMAGFLRMLEVDDEALIERVSREYRDRWFEELVLDEFAPGILAQLHRNHRLALITNGPASTQRVKIDQFRLAEMLDVLIVSGEVGVEKPDPAIFRIALDALGTAPSETLFVGDSIENDLRGAAAAGMPFVWINRRNEKLPEDVPPPLAIITSLDQLPPLVEKQEV